MKKVIGLCLMLSSLACLATDTLECGLFKGTAGTLIKKVKANLNDENIYVYETNQEERASISIVSQEGDFVRVRISQPEDYNQVVLNKNMLLTMKENASFGVIIDGSKDNQMSAVCYKGSAPF